MWKTPPREDLIGAAFEIPGKRLSCWFLFVYAQHWGRLNLQKAARCEAQMLRLQVTHY